MKKIYLYSALGLSIAAAGWALYPNPKDEPVRANVIDSTKGQSVHKTEPAHDETSSSVATSQSENTVGKNGNPIGLPVRMINAPSFNQIVAAAAMINGAVDQKETAGFIELSTSKRIASLNVELANLEAELSKAKLAKLEYDKKIGNTTDNESANNNSHSSDEFVMAGETPAAAAPANQNSPLLLANATNKTEQEPSTDDSNSSSNKEKNAVQFSKTMKLKGFLDDGRYSLQLGNDFASNVRINQVVWSRYRIDSFDSGTNCLSYTDLKLKNSHGITCYN
jgi:hypothetical protein